MSEVEKVAKGLTDAQLALVLASGVDDITVSLQADQQEGLGVEIRGPQYRVARALSAMGLGDYTHGSPYYDMYWNNPFGLAVRTYLLEKQQ
jgi:hypothetical protein